MNRPNYPSPCLKCKNSEKCSKSSGIYTTCKDWNKWFRWWWKYFQENLGKEDTAQKNRSKFYYEYPDIIRKQLSVSPCDKCSKNEKCVNICREYIRFYDNHRKMERRRLEQ